MEFGFPADFKLRWLWDQQQAKPQPLPGPRCVLGGGWEVWGRQLRHLSGAHPQVLPPACPPSSCTRTPVLQNHQTAGPLLPPQAPATTAAVGALHWGREPLCCPCVPSREAAGRTPAGLLAALGQLRAGL
uniref:Uncharacterized protein n=1 Tax=Myotis myotis TaxID=51298 RepID=A0A7J7U5J9_MYOMY|nr:hypothetical protein mMyoMyo1_008876 [Myotis myotis]